MEYNDDIINENEIFLNDEYDENEDIIDDDIYDSLKKEKEELEQSDIEEDYEDNEYSNDELNDEDNEQINEEDEIEKINKNLISSIFGNLTNNESYINDLSREDIYIDFDKNIHFNKLTIYEYIYISRMIKNLINEKSNMKEIIKKILLENQLDITVIRFIPYNKILKIDLKDLEFDIDFFYKILDI